MPMAPKRRRSKSPAIAKPRSAPDPFDAPGPPRSPRVFYPVVSAIGAIALLFAMAIPVLLTWESALPGVQLESGAWILGESGVCMIPHPEKAYRGGEDAYFITSSVIGVADGVGGWAQHGIDPGLYSRALMGFCKAEALAVSADVDPVGVLRKAYDQIVAAKVKGSCTATILAVNHGRELHAANLGDSGFLIIRRGVVEFKSPPQQHSWNSPFQLGPESVDRPEHASRHVIDLQEGDLIVTGTDGLFDNLFDEDVVRICADAVKAGSRSQEIAKQLAEKAHECAASQYCVTPFGAEARAHGRKHFGGKMDDITCIISAVHKAPSK